MKVNIIDEFNFIVFLNKDCINGIDFDNYKIVESYFKDLFKKLNRFYNIDLYGFYDINMYKDDNYGIILDVVKDELDSSYYHQTDIRIVSEKTSFFLYKIDDICYVLKDLKHFQIYYYKNNFYLKVKDRFNIMNILEYIEVIYGSEVEDIINFGEKIEVVT